MDQQVEGNKKSWSGSGVYDFIRDLIVEGKDAWLVDDKGRFRINWLTAPMCYQTDFKSRTDKIDNRNASNKLRSALLNSHEKDGAKEYIECQKKNAKGQIIERQFQMPPRIFELLFGPDMLLSDEGCEQDMASIISEAFKSSSDTGDSTDTGIDEAMDSADEVFNTSEQDIGLRVPFGFPTAQLLDGTRNEEISPEPPEITAPFEIFGIPQEELNQPLDDQQGGVVGIYPSAGSTEGGLPFVITLKEMLPPDDASEICVADFDGVGVVILEKFEPSASLCGITPSAWKPGSVQVTVKTQANQLLGITSFQYVDPSIQEVLKQMVKDPGLQSLYETLRMQHSITNNAAQNQGSFMQGQGSSNHMTHAQDFRVTQSLFFAMLSRSGFLGTDYITAKDQSPFTFQDQAVTKDETDLESVQSEDEDNQSDYFADVETSSCGSFDLEVGWSESDGPSSNDGGTGRKISKKSNPSLKGTSCEMLSEVGLCSGENVGKKDYDDGNYEDSSIVSSKRSWNFFKWARKKLKNRTHKKRHQGVFVDETHDKQSFMQRIGERGQESEFMKTRQEAAKIKKSQFISGKEAFRKNFANPAGENFNMADHVEPTIGLLQDKQFKELLETVQGDNSSCFLSMGAGEDSQDSLNFGVQNDMGRGYGQQYHYISSSQGVSDLPTTSSPQPPAYPHNIPYSPGPVAGHRNSSTCISPISTTPHETCSNYSDTLTPGTTTTPPPVMAPSYLPMHAHLPTIPSTTEYNENWSFEISFGPLTESASKTATGTYSDVCKKLYVNLASYCPIKFKTSMPPPPGTHLRAVAIFKGSTNLHDIVKKFPNHMECSDYDYKNSNSGTGVYDFIRHLTVKGDAWLVDDKGRFGINWSTAPMLYHTEFKLRTDIIDSRKASNNLRSALLNSHGKDGAKEFTGSQKRGDDGKIVEREFQMPPKIFVSLFGSDMLLSDEGCEQDLDSIASEACKRFQETSESSDTGIDEGMDSSGDGTPSTINIDANTASSESGTEEAGPGSEKSSREESLFQNEERGLNLPVGYKYISRRQRMLNGKDKCETLALEAECRVWEAVDNPTEKLLATYGER